MVLWAIGRKNGSFIVAVLLKELKTNKTLNLGYWNNV